MTDPNGWPDASKPGYPSNPERDGTYWIIGWEGKLFVGEWHPEAEHWSWSNDGSSVWWSAAGMPRLGLGYAGPCLTPAEVKAKVAAARREEQLSAFEAGAKSMRIIIENAARIAALQEEERIDAIRAVLEAEARDG